MKPQYHFVILLSLGSFLPAHGMFSWGSGSDENQKKERAQKEKEKKKRVKATKTRLREKIEDLPVSDNLKNLLKGDDIDESIIYVWDLVKKNKSAMKEKFEQEIGDIPYVGSIASFVATALNKTVGCDIPQVMVNGMLDKQDAVHAAFRWANNEEQKKQNSINVFAELSKIDKKKKPDLVKRVTLCFLIKIDLCLEENQEKLTEVFKKESPPFVLRPFISGIINSAVQKSSSWHDTFITMAQNSLCPKEDKT